MEILRALQLHEFQFLLQALLQEGKIRSLEVLLAHLLQVLGVLQLSEDVKRSRLIVGRTLE